MKTDTSKETVIHYFGGLAGEQTLRTMAEKALGKNEDIRAACLLININSVDMFSLKQWYPNVTFVSKYVSHVSDTIKIFEGHSSMKFDCCIMNPPYDGNLHLRILEVVLEHVDKVVNISPVRWLQDPFALGKRSEFRKFEESVSRKLSSIEVVDRDVANMIFGIGLYSDLGIYVSGTGFDYKNFWKIGRSPNEISILDKVCFSGKSDSVDGHISKRDCSTGIHVLISGIAGGRGNKPIYKYYGIVKDGNTPTGEDFLTVWNAHPKHKAWPRNDLMLDSIEFRTVEEARNFYDSYNTTFLGYVCDVTCQQQHIQLQKLPYLGDYTHPWTDKDLCDYFGITGYISDTEAEPGSEWETILKAI